MLIDGLDPFGGGELVPVGRLREPLDELARASIFVVTRTEQDLRFDAIRRRLERYNGDAPVFRTRLVARHWVDYQTGERVPKLPALRVAAFCGLGNPESFWSTLEKLNLEIVFTMEFPGPPRIPADGTVTRRPTSALPWRGHDSHYREGPDELPSSPWPCDLPLQHGMAGN